MIQIHEHNIDLLKDEFNKGNIYMLSKVRYSDQKNLSIIKNIKEIENKIVITRDRYTFSEHIMQEMDSIMNTMNFDNWDFIILTREEAEPYIKEMVVDSICMN